MAKCYIRNSEGVVSFWRIDKPTRSEAPKGVIVLDVQPAEAETRKTNPRSAGEVGAEEAKHAVHGIISKCQG